MKRYLILLLPSALFPYVFLFFLFGFFRGFLLDWIGENPLLLFLWLGIWFFVSLLANLAFFLLALGKQWAGKSLALASMVLKLIQIPAYVTVFLLSCIFAITIWLFAFVIVLFFFDCLTILLTGFMGLAASIRCAGKAGFQGPLHRQRYPVLCVLRRRGAGNYLFHQIQTAGLTTAAVFKGGWFYCFIGGEYPLQIKIPN